MSTTWRTVAFVSLAINLLVAGAAIGFTAAGARIQVPGAAEPSRGAAERPLRALVEAMPPERRAETRREIARAFAETRAARKDARDARGDLARIAGAEPFDAAAAKAAFARIRAADAAVTAQFQDAVVDRIAALPPEERRAVLRSLLQRRAARAAAIEGETDAAAAGAPVLAAPPPHAAAPAHERAGQGAHELREDRIRRFLERRREAAGEAAPAAEPTP